MTLQRLARSRLSATLVHRRRLLRFVTVLQGAFRARIMRDVALARRQERDAKIVRCVRLVQLHVLGKAAELVYQERAEEAVDLLSAEVEVLREMQEERRRAEAARREALKAKIRQDKGLPAAEPEAAPEPPAVEAEPPARAPEAAPPSEVTLAPPPPVVQAPPPPALAVAPEPPPIVEAVLNASFVYDSAKLTQMEVQLKKQARQLSRVEAQLARTSAQLMAREKECATLKDRLHQEEAARRAAEAALERERLERKLAQQKVDELLGNQEAERQQEAELVKTAVNHPELLHVLTDDKRKNIQLTWKKLDTLERDLVHLSTSAILMAPFANEAEHAVKRELNALRDKIRAQGERNQPPKDVFHMTDLVRRVKDALRETADFPAIHQLLKEFCQFCLALDKSLADIHCLPRDELVQHLRKPLELLHTLMLLSTRKKFEDRETTSLHGLDTATPVFSKNITLDRLRRHHETVLRKYEEREYCLQQKVVKTEEIVRDVARLLEGMDDLDRAQAELQRLRGKFEEARAQSEEEDRQLKHDLYKFVTDQTEPAAAVLQKQRQKEEEIARVRQALKQKQLDIQEDFLRLLHAEETVACIKRETSSMGQMRGHLEVEIARLREEAQSRVEGMEGGVMLLLKEQRLATELKTMLQHAADQLRTGAVATLGHTQELNYQLIQRHYVSLEAFYNDAMQLLQHQRQQLAEEEALLAAGGPKGRGVTAYFRSQDKVLQRQQDVVARRRQDIVHTLDALQSIKDRFCNLYHFSNALRVAEFLAKHDKAKYGTLLSTNTIPDPLTTFLWPEVNDVLSQDARGSPTPLDSSSPASPGPDR